MVSGWRVIRRKDADGEHFQVAGQDSLDTVCTVDNEDHARLFAAAPNMAAFIKSLQCQCQWSYKSSTHLFKNMVVKDQKTKVCGACEVLGLLNK